MAFYSSAVLIVQNIKFEKFPTKPGGESKTVDFRLIVLHPRANTVNNIMPINAKTTRLVMNGRKVKNLSFRFDQRGQQ
jgi:hypothetical protein